MSLPLDPPGGSSPPRPARPFAPLFLACLAFTLAVYGLVAPRLGMAEDAAILYLYSENLADTGVISYYAGGPPTEGATDFLWMVLLAGLRRLGLDTHLAAALLSAAAHVGTAWLVMRLGGGGERRLFLCAFAGLFLVPAFGAALLGFSVFAFALLVLACALCFVERRTAALAVTALVTCLVRPDGVVFTAPLLAAAWVLEPERRALVARHALLLFAVPFLAYFAWRAWYFGHWLPLPFYVKSGSSGWAGRLERLTRLSNLKPIVPILPALLWCAWELRRSAPRARAALLALLLALVLVPFVFYSSFERTQSIGLRYEFPMVLVAMVLPAVPFGGARRGLRALVPAGLGLLLLLPSTVRQAASMLLMPLHGFPDLARDLAALRGARTMAVTEAGWLPYYSRWKCVDLWGLNTPECARVAVPVSFLEREAPDLFVLNASPVEYRRMLRGEAQPAEASEHTWTGMVNNTFLFALRNEYELLMLPSERDEGRAPHVPALTRFVRRALPEFDLSEHHHMVFLASRSEAHGELRRVLLAHGGIPLAEHLARLRARQRGF